MEKVVPSARFRAELDDALARIAGDDDPIATVGRLGARLILQQALDVPTWAQGGRFAHRTTARTKRSGIAQQQCVGARIVAALAGMAAGGETNLDPIPR